MTAYHRPESLDDALVLLRDGRARVAAGCTDLFPATQARRLEGEIVDITGIAGLSEIAQDPDGVRIGAAARWSDVMRANLPGAFDMLKQAAREVGSVQIQNTGTLVGNLCNASPAADGIPCLLALDAEVELASVQGRRRVAMAAFVTGARQTARRPDELVVAVHIPARACHGASRFLKLGARRYLVISIAMVAVRLVRDGDQVAEAAVAVGSCSAVATRLSTLEADLVGQPVTETLANAATQTCVVSELSAIDDIRADAAYRGVAATELVRRALVDVCAREAVE